MKAGRMNRRELLKTGASFAMTGALAMTGCTQARRETADGGSSTSLPARGEYLIRGATVLSLDPEVGDLPQGDVHVRDGPIVGVAASISAPSATVIDAGDMICMPGFVDTHWHLWTTVCRPVMRIDNAELGYFPVSNALGRHYTPEDSYRSVRLGLMEAISAGATTVHNWAHNVRSPEHADAELRAMRDMGMRGRFAYGPAQGMPNDQPMDLDGLAQIQKAWMPNDGMLTLGICSRNVGASQTALRGSLTLDMVRTDWGGARALGLPISVHTSGPSPIMLLEQAKLLGPDLQLVHPLLTTAEERAILAARGVSYSTSPMGESRRPAKAGVIQLGELLDAGVKVSMSIDHTGTFNCDFFQCMRVLYNLHQHRIGQRVPLTARRLVQLATLDGAVDLGIADRTGSLKPGKRADLILARTGDINIAPLGDPYEALVSFAQPQNVDTVMIDGRILRRANRFIALDPAQILREARESITGLLQRANLRT